VQRINLVISAYDTGLSPPMYETTKLNVTLISPPFTLAFFDISFNPIFSDTSPRANLNLILLLHIPRACLRFLISYYWEQENPWREETNMISVFSFYYMRDRKHISCSDVIWFKIQFLEIFSQGIKHGFTPKTPVINNNIWLLRKMS